MQPETQIPSPTLDVIQYSGYVPLVGGPSVGAFPPLNVSASNDLRRQLALHDHQIHEMQVHLSFLTATIGGIPRKVVNQT